MSKYRLEFNDATGFEIGRCRDCVLSHDAYNPFHNSKRRVCVMGYDPDECPLEEVEECGSDMRGV